MSAFASGDSSPVDRDKGIIKRVKILGLDSPNSHAVAGAKSTRYTLEALKAARPLYEGVACKWNHRSRNKPHNEDDGAEEKIGVLRSVTVESDGLYGNLHVNRSHPHAAILFEDAERPDLRQLSLSHDADGQGPVENGVFVVKRIPMVRSVDVVYRGATNKTLFESQARGTTAMSKTTQQVWQETWLRPDLSAPRKRWAAKIIESYCGTMKVKTKEGEMPMGDMPVDDMPADGGAPGEALKAGVRTECVAVIDDCLNGGGDPAECLKRVKDLLTAHAKLSGTDEPEPPAADEVPAEAAESLAAKKAAADAIALRESQATDKLARYEAVEKLLESAKQRDVSPAIKAALLALSTDEERQAVLNEMVRLKNPPRSTSPNNAPPAPNAKAPAFTEATYEASYERLFKRKPASVALREADAKK